MDPMDLLDLLEGKQKRLANEAKLNAILDRPDEDFLVYTKRDHSLGTFMRWKRCPRQLWLIWVRLLSLGLKSPHWTP